MKNCDLRVLILDYGVGNVGSINNMLRRHCNIDAPIVSSAAQEILSADAIILPGVGTFDACMNQLIKRDVLDSLLDVTKRGSTSILATCVGMQILFGSSEEGNQPGLNIFDGTIKKFNPDLQNIKIPHMGWNSIDVDMSDPLFKNLQENRFYFCHSYCYKDLSQSFVTSSCFHGEKFVSSVRKGKVWATQFHPEKSHKFGIQLYKNFIEIARDD